MKPLCHMLSAAVAALSLAALPAAAMIDPCLIDEEVRAAEVVVQIEVQKILRRGNVCEVSGKVAHVLRGAAQEGDAVTVEVQCIQEVEVMCGGTVQNLEALKRAEMVELHLTGGQVTGAGDGFDIIDAKDAGTEQHIYNCEG